MIDKKLPFDSELLELIQQNNDEDFKKILNSESKKNLIEQIKELSEELQKQKNHTKLFNNKSYFLNIKDVCIGILHNWSTSKVLLNYNNNVISLTFTTFTGNLPPTNKKISSKKISSIKIEISSNDPQLSIKIDDQDFGKGALAEVCKKLEWVQEWTLASCIEATVKAINRKKKAVNDTNENGKRQQKNKRGHYNKKAKNSNNSTSVTPKKPPHYFIDENIYNFFEQKQNMNKDKDNNRTNNNIKPTPPE